MKSDTFCILPWMHLATNSSGNLRVCCNSTPGKNLIRKDDGSPYKLYSDDLLEAWNSPVYKKIRQEFLNGKKPDMCQRCFREEEVGIESARQFVNSKWKEDLQYDNNAPFNIKYIDLRLGNLCNLKCRMCNPFASNQWIKEWSLINEALTTDEVIRLKKMGWPEYKRTWENIIPLIHSVEEIYLTGGEPTIIKEQHKILDYCIENKIAKNIKLKYNTNLTNIPEHLINKWKQFKVVQLNCSIDATGDLDRYIRYPSDWKTIEQNFTDLNNLDNVNTEIHCTVQMYNILRIQELIEWVLLKNCKIYFNILNHPDCLNIRVLPVNLKKVVVDNLKIYYDVPKVKGIIDYMLAEDWIDKLEDFCTYTQKLDYSRNENLKNLIPEFKDVFEKKIL